MANWRHIDCVAANNFGVLSAESRVPCAPQKMTLAGGEASVGSPAALRAVALLRLACRGSEWPPNVLNEGSSSLIAASTADPPV